MTKNLKPGSQEDLEDSADLEDLDLEDLDLEDLDLEDLDLEDLDLEDLDLEDLDFEDLVVGSHCYWSCLVNYIQNSGYKYIMITFTGVHMQCNQDTTTTNWIIFQVT